MDVRIVYATKTKHSQKLAEAVGERLKAKPENISLHPAPKSCDLLIIVGGIYGGESMPELIQFIQELDASMNRRAALITSCGSGRQGQATVRKILEDKGIKVTGEFICKGSILFVSIKHPDSKDMKEAADFAEKAASIQA